MNDYMLPQNPVSMQATLLHTTLPSSSFDSGLVLLFPQLLMTSVSMPWSWRVQKGMAALVIIGFFLVILDPTYLGNYGFYLEVHLFRDFNMEGFSFTLCYDQNTSWAI